MNNLFLVEFIKNCKYVKITSLNLNTNINHFNLKNQIKAIQAHVELNKGIKKFFKKLIKFELNCIAFDSKQLKYFHAFNETNFIKLFFNNKLKCLTHLCLIEYNNSLNDLLECLGKNFKKLKNLKFEYCESSLDNEIEIFEDKLHIEELEIINCSEDLFRNVLLNLIDLNFVKRLALFNDKKKQKKIKLRLIEDLDLKLKSLDKLETNFSYKIFIKINFQFSIISNITQFQLVQSLDNVYASKLYCPSKFISIEGLNKFITNYLIPNKNNLFKNLKLLKFELKLDCLKIDERYIDNMVLKFYKNLSALSLLNIKMYCYEHGTKLKNCKLYKKYFCKKSIFKIGDFLNVKSNESSLKIIFNY